MADEYRYTYGVTDDPPAPFDADGVGGGTEIYTVDYRSLSAIVSDIDTLEPEESEANVRAHDEVLRAAMTRNGGRTVVPMRFGMVFESERPLKNVLRRGRPGFVGALRDVEDMVELGVKVVAPADASVDESAIQEAVDEELDPLADDVARGDRFSDRLVLNRSYLIHRDEREAFDEAIDRLRDRVGDVTVQYTGPWAPYTFVDLQIGVAQ